MGRMTMWSNVNVVRMLLAGVIVQTKDLISAMLRQCECGRYSLELEQHYSRLVDLKTLLYARVFYF